MTPATASQRAIAKLIDAVLSFFVFYLVMRLTKGLVPSIAAAYLWFMLSDGFGSLGKAFVGIKCVDAKTGADCGYGASLLRNCVFLPSFGRAMLKAQHDPALDLWFQIAAVTSVILMILELRWMVARRDKRRLGDALGDTRVIVRPR